MAIPKIIHQTYKTNEMPRQLEEYRRKLIELHPGWDYRFYGDHECRDIVEQYFPSFLPIYEGSSAPVQKADIFRIIVVNALGGFYLDIDVECIKSLDELCEFHCVFAEELTIKEEEAKQLGHRDCLRVANYMFGSEPAHPFLLHILRKIAEESQYEITSEHDLLESTGPGLVTTVYHNLCEELQDMVLLRNIDRTCPVDGGVSCNFGNYAKHHHVGTWRWENFPNPPKAVSAKRQAISQSQVHTVLREIDLEIDRFDIPEPIFQLRTYKEAPYDGLTYVYDRTSRLGILTDDTSNFVGEKVLVSGLPTGYLDKLSIQNTNVLYTTFESSLLPTQWVDAINKYFHYCIVPHAHVKSVFENSELKIPIEVIQQGFTRYKRKERKALEAKTFNIGFLGVPVERKNLFKLFQACVHLLADIPELRLRVHVPDYYGHMKAEYLGLVKMSPFVDWTEGHLIENEIADWYSELSCYVFPSSGEGWSFTPRESLYLGVPTILSDIPVHKELVESGYCKAIPVSGKEEADFNGIISGVWDKVSVADIENSIRELYLNYGSYYIKALQGSQWIEDKWTNEGSQQKLLDFLVTL